MGPGALILSLADPATRWSAAVESLFTDARKHARLSRLAKQHARRPEQSLATIVARFLKFIAA